MASWDEVSGQSGKDVRLEMCWESCQSVWGGYVTPLSQAQSNITKETLNLNITPVRQKEVQECGLDMRIGWSHDLRWKLQHRVECNNRLRGWHRALERIVVDNPPHTCAGTKGGKPTINGLGVVHSDRWQFWYKGSCGTQWSNEGPLWVMTRDGSWRVCYPAYESNTGWMCIIWVLTKHLVGWSLSGHMHKGWRVLNGISWIVILISVYPLTHPTS